MFSLDQRSSKVFLELKIIIGTAQSQDMKTKLSGAVDQLERFSILSRYDEFHCLDISG
jgi:hypothetical protein